MSAGKWQGFATITPPRLVIVVALSLVLFYNSALWHALNTHMPLDGMKAFVFYLSFAGFVTAYIHLFLTLVAFRYLLKPVVMLLLLCSAFAAYFMSSYGVAIDSVMVQNIFETNVSEASALFSVRLLAYVFFLGIVPMILIWRVPVVYPSFRRGLLNQALALVLSLVVAAAMAAPFYSSYASLFRKSSTLTNFINPTNYIHAVSKYARQRLVIKEAETVIPIGEDSKPGAGLAARPKKSLVIFVVGETARADHFSINGYGRETNPELAKQDILNYTDVHACGTSTAVSVPCMFSKFGHDDYSDKKGKTHEGALDMLQRAGVNVFWRDNNSDCKGTCQRVPSDDVTRRKNSPFCNDVRCLDEVMLEDLQAYVDKLPDHALIVLHSDGSHGPAYFDRYPEAFERFRPACKTNQLGSCTQEEVINVYDNTILYTDHFLSQVIEFLKRNEAQRDTAMLYVSDHGESLGENGLYLHAAPYAMAPEAQTHVPMIAWFSPDAYTHWGINRECLHSKQEDPLSHDNIFHTLLGLFEIQSKEYRPELDMFNGCRSGSGAASSRRQ